MTIRPRRGMPGAPLGLDDIRHLYEIIGALESAAILSGAPRLTGRAVARMRPLNREMMRALAADDFSRYYDRNLRLPRCLPGPHRQRAARSAHGAGAEGAPLRLPAPPGVRQGVGGGLDRRARGHREPLAQGNVQAAADYVRDVHWSFAVQERFIHRYYFARERRRGQREHGVHGRHLQRAALLGARRPGHPHHGVPQGLPRALPVVPQPGEPVVRPELVVAETPLHRLRRVRGGLPPTHPPPGVRSAARRAGACVEACPPAPARSRPAGSVVERWWRRCCGTAPSTRSRGAA